jgi:hypothetical protein
MNKELTQRLVKRFPVLYQGFYDSMQETCMCWGFEHGDGWFEVIWQLSLAIEEELGYTRFQKWRFLAKKRWAKRWNKLVYKISPVVHDKTKMVKGDDNVYRHVIIEKAKPRLPWLKRFVWFPYTGFAVMQVKEKFGTLRFYCPTTPQIAKFVRLAERLSGVTCEDCGKYGELETSGWWNVRCDECRVGKK